LGACYWREFSDSAPTYYVLPEALNTINSKKKSAAKLDEK
jgi:hypothetical protein